MIITATFILFLLLENLFLPALMGPGLFLITPIFILSMIIYRNNWKILVFQAVPFILVAEIFTGAKVGSLLIPLVLIAGFYFWLNRFFNFTDGLKNSVSFSSLIAGAILLGLLGYLYAWIFILFSSSYDIGSTWIQWKIFLLNSTLSMFGWSMTVSVLFKYVFKEK